MRLILALVAFLAAGAALAGDAPLSWTHNGKNTDGSAATLTGFRIYYDTDDTLDRVIDIPNGALRAYVVTGLPPGTWHFAMTAYSADGESVRTGTVTRDIAQPAPPQPPTSVTLTARPAYTIKQTQDNVAVVPVGSVPAATACDATRGVIVTGKPYYRVPVSAVSWIGTVRPVVVFADCS
jgi:hypothetical protein